MLEKRTFKEAVDADWALSREYGITGVPTFVAGRFGVVGAQPYEAAGGARAEGGERGAEESPTAVGCRRPGALDSGAGAAIPA